MNKEEIKQAIAWYHSRGIEAREVNDAVYIYVKSTEGYFINKEHEIEISTGEVLYRSELFKEENNEQ